jgi:D-psicose/D-tagatose/L-ribulose 3-epimerase
VKFGVHIALWMKSWDDNVVPYIEEAARIGFDGVELSLLGMDDDAIERIGHTLKANRLELTCTTGLASSTDITSADPAVREAGITYLKWAVDTVAALGGTTLSGVIYAPWGKRTMPEREVRWRRSVEALRQVAPHAAARGVALGIEAINRYETDLVTTAAQAVRMAEDTGYEGVGVLLDTYHLNIEEKDIGAALRVAGRRLIHMHVVENDRGVPGSGNIAWDAVAQALSDIGYGGWVTLEMFVQAGVAVSPDLAIWRPIDPSEAARRGLAFLQERLS